MDNVNVVRSFPLFVTLAKFSTRLSICWRAGHTYSLGTWMSMSSELLEHERHFFDTPKCAINLTMRIWIRTCWCWCDLSTFSLSGSFNNIRPRITKAPTFVGYKQIFDVVFTTTTRQGAVECNMQSAPWSTHSYSQGQRLIKLVTTTPVRVGNSWSVKCTAPPSANVAPQQFYMLVIVQNNVPSKALWVKMG